MKRYGECSQVWFCDLHQSITRAAAQLPLSTETYRMRTISVLKPQPELEGVPFGWQGPSSDKVHL